MQSCINAGHVLAGFIAVFIQSVRTDSPEQTMYTQIRRCGMWVWSGSTLFATHPIAHTEILIIPLWNINPDSSLLRMENCTRKIYIVVTCVIVCVYIIIMDYVRKNWVASNEKLSSNMRKMRTFRSSCECAKYHPGLCSPFILSVVANDSVSGQWRPWSDCADTQADRGFAVRICPKTLSRTTRSSIYGKRATLRAESTQKKKKKKCKFWSYDKQNIVIFMFLSYDIVHYFHIFTRQRSQKNQLLNLINKYFEMNYTYVKSSIYFTGIRYNISLW